MVNVLMIVIGLVGFGALYILLGDLFTGKHKAILFDRHTIKIVPANKSKDGREYIFKHAGKKYSVTPKDNEFPSTKNGYITLWYIENQVALPVKKTQDGMKIHDIDKQLSLVNALLNTEKKIGVNWWDQNKEVVVGIIAIVAGVVIYVVSAKMAGDISPESVNACIQIAADIKNSTLTTESNINKLVDIFSNTPK